MGQVRLLKSTLANGFDHVPTAEKRWHRLENLALSCQHSNPCWSKHFMSAEDHPVCIPIDRSRLAMRNALGCIDEDFRSHAVCCICDSSDRIDRSKHIGNRRDTHKLRAGAQDLIQ